jgi:hypothetical protein
VKECVSHSTGGAIGEVLDASCFDAFTTPNGVPFEAGEAVDRKPNCRRIIKINGDSEAFVSHEVCYGYMSVSFPPIRDISGLRLLSTQSRHSMLVAS